ncbi:MAG: type IA DNA topoisomerase, partial [Clostridia bacterium]|nr:type IA DNA topoisomerase [Clostridia bacterium]
MILIIAEKPSLARNIAAGIGKMQRADGFLYDKNYIITWAFGHLFSLCDIEDYAPSNAGHWTLDNIPCFPEKFEFRLKRDRNNREDLGVKKQFETIKTLINREDVDTVVNAGDSDREGEIIVRICIDKAANAKKAFKRLWLPDQT